MLRGGEAGSELIFYTFLALCLAGFILRRCFCFKCQCRQRTIHTITCTSVAKHVWLLCGAGIEVWDCSTRTHSSTRNRTTAGRLMGWHNNSIRRNFELISALLQMHAMNWYILHNWHVAKWVYCICAKHLIMIHLNIPCFLSIRRDNYEIRQLHQKDRITPRHATLIGNRRSQCQDGGGRHTSLLCHNTRAPLALSHCDVIMYPQTIYK